MGRTSHRRPNRPAATASRQRVVERAEAFVRADAAPVPVSTLCDLLGLSERALRNAFYSVRGMSPKRWMLAERLQGVRSALSQACAGPVTVTDVATDFGFYELGRFAATYKEAFGEAPSETVARIRREAVREQNVTHERAR